MRTVTFACHVAYLEDMTGDGLLVLPKPADDVPDPLTVGSLHASDWGAVVAFLHREGWEPTEDEWGCMTHEGYDAEGREVIGLYGHRPITSIPTMRESSESFSALRTLAGVLPTR